MATRNALAVMLDAGFVERLTVGRIRAGADGVVAVPSTWRLKMRTGDQNNVPAGKDMHATHVLVQRAHFMDRSAGWIVRPGGDVDVTLGGWTFVESLAAAMLLASSVTSGVREWTVVDLARQRGCDRATAVRHVDRFVRLGLVRVVRPGARGRGHAAVYVLDAVGLAAFVERVHGKAETVVCDRVAAESRAAVDAVTVWLWRNRDVASLRFGVVESDDVNAEPPALLVVVDGHVRPGSRTAVVRGAARDRDVVERKVAAHAVA